MKMGTSNPLNLVLSFALNLVLPGQDDDLVRHANKPSPPDLLDQIRQAKDMRDAALANYNCCAVGYEVVLWHEYQASEARYGALLAEARGGDGERGEP